jgi:hypothetical protein
LAPEAKPVDKKALLDFPLRCRLLDCWGEYMTTDSGGSVTVDRSRENVVRKYLRFNEILKRPEKILECSHVNHLVDYFLVLRRVTVLPGNPEL